MTFLESLQSHKGGLIRLHTDLYWYGRDWDKNPGRVCIILNAAATTRDRSFGSRWAYDAVAATTHADIFRIAAIVVLLLIDSAPQWVCVAEEDVELVLMQKTVNDRSVT
jgi:hypothetical protein